MKSISNIILGLLLSLTASATSIVNPMTWADCPDPDVIRVGDTFYMVTTTMHLMPGAPVMRSKDLVHWETVSYVFDRQTPPDTTCKGAPSMDGDNGQQP